MKKTKCILASTEPKPYLRLTRELFTVAIAITLSLLLGGGGIAQTSNNDVILQVDGYFMKAALETLQYSSEKELDEKALNYFASNEFRDEFRARNFAGATQIAGVPVAIDYSDAQWEQFQKQIKALGTRSLSLKERSYFFESRGLKVVADTWLKAIELATKSKIPPLKVEVNQDSSETRDVAVTVSGPFPGGYAKVANVISVGCHPQRTFLEAVGIVSTIRAGAEIPSGGVSGKFRKEHGHPMPHVVIASTMGYGVAALKRFPAAPSGDGTPDPVPSLTELVFPNGVIENKKLKLSEHLQRQGFGESGDERDKQLKYQVKWSIEVDEDWKVRVKHHVEVWSPISRDEWGTSKTAIFEDEVERDFGNFRKADPLLNGYELILDPAEPAQSAMVTGDTGPGRPIEGIRFNGPSSTIITAASALTGGGQCQGAVWRIA